MSSPARPDWQPQGPATRCVINGRALGWVNCTPTSTAMGIHKTTLRKRKPSGCAIRQLTGDTVGGTTLQQNAAAAAHYGLVMTVHAGSNVATDEQIASWLRQGRGVVAQGNTKALTSHPGVRSTGGPVNHAVWFNDVRGGTYYAPDEVWAADPAADGRTAGWGKADQGPTWWPWEIAKNFFAQLHPWGEDDSRILGPNKVYAGVFKDTEPHVHLKYTGSVRTSPFPKHMIVRSPTAGRRVNVRTGPSTSHSVASTQASGSPWIAYQQNARGQLLGGSRLWYGDHSGTRWIHSSGLIVPRTVGAQLLSADLPFEDDEPIVGAEITTPDESDTSEQLLTLDGDELPDDVRDGDIGQYE